MLYHSKKPTVHYLLPEDYSFPEGDFEIYSTKSKKVLVDKKDVLTYKIGNTEAMKLLTSELNTQIGDFMEGIKNIAAKVSPNKKDAEHTTSETNTSNSNHEDSFTEKLSGGLDFLSLSTQVMKVFWKIANTNDEDELATLKKEMIALKLTFQEKGYQPNDNFEELPFILKAKYKSDDKLNEFRESAKEFQQIISDLIKTKASKDK